MRLLDTRTIRFVNVSDPRAVTYAILSHTWDLLGEQSLQELSEIQRTHPGDTVPSSPALSPKIRDFCAFARKAGYDYCWIDSCCIDKTSSSELTESINSMYAWYGIADVCYTYLADVSSAPTKWEGEFRASRWHRRGWTLQELIAPKKLVFLSCDWLVLGSKAALASFVEDVTGISTAVLMFEEPLSAVPVARRMSWAASRETTRAEDRAYSLFGIFDVQLPTIYGEGGEKAFTRLQEEILRHTPDQSIFAWGLRPLPGDGGALRLLRRSGRSTFSVTRQHGLLASSPGDFEGSRDVEPVPYSELRATLRLVSPDTVTLPSLDCSAYAVPSNPPVYPIKSPSGSGPTHVAILACRDPTRGWVALLLREQSNTTRPSHDFSIGAHVWPHTPAPSGDESLQLGYVRGAYIIDETTAILRADVVLSELQRQWGYIFNLLSASGAVAMLVVAGALAAGMDEIFTDLEPAVTRICSAFASVTVVGWGSSYYLLLEVFKERDLTAVCNEKETERMSFFLLRQVPALCLFTCSTTLTVCQYLVVTRTVDRGTSNPLEALCILVLVIAFEAIAYAVLIQSIRRVHYASPSRTTR